MENEMVVTEFEKNSREVVRAVLKTWNGRELFDLRVYYKTDSGEVKPTQKGLCLQVDKIGDLKNSIAEIERHLREAPVA